MENLKMLISTVSPKLLFYKNFKKFINFKNLKDINEKIQYLKFNQYKDNEIITNCVDKYMVRKYIVEKGMKDLLPKLYDMYYTANEIE